jgi:hypothetical protein
MNEDDTQPDVFERGNVTFHEQRTMIEESIDPLADASSLSLFNTSNSDCDWDMMMTLTKPFLIAGFEMSTTQTSTTIMELFGIPSGVFSQTVYANQPAKLIKNFSLMRTNFNFTLFVNGNIFQLGRIIMFYVPPGDSNMDRNSLGFSLAQASQYTNVIIDVSESASGTLHIPYNHWNTGFNMKDDVDMGQIIVMVFNPLLVAGDTTNLVPCKLFCYLDATELHVPTNDINTFPVPTVKTVSPMQILAGKVQAGRSNFSKLKAAPKAPAKGKASASNNRLASTSKAHQQPSSHGRGTNMEEVIEDTNNISVNITNPPAPTSGPAPSAQPQETKKSGGGGGIFDTLGNLAGSFLGEGGLGDLVSNGIKTLGPMIPALLDRPIGVNNEDHLIATSGSVSHGDGVDSSTRLSLAARSAHLIPPAYVGVSTNQHSMLSIMQVPSYIGTVDWNSTNVENDIQYTTMVSPLLSEYYDDNTISPSFLMFVSRAFTYYRGGIKFRIEAVASHLHSGRLAFNFTPTATGINDATQVNFSALTYMDMKEKHEVEFTIPYNKNMPWLPLHGIFPVAIGNPPYMRFETDDIPYPSTLGCLRVIVVNRLTHPANIPGTVRLNIFISAADDFEVAVPYAIDSFRTPFGLPNVIPAIHEKFPNRTFTLTGKVQGPIEVNSTRSEKQNNDDAERMQLGDTKIVPFNGHFLGDVVDDVRIMTRRYCEAYQLEILGITPSLPIYTFIPVAPAQYSHAPTSWLEYFSQIFVYWTGSIRFKILCSTSKNYAINARVTHLMPQKLGVGATLGILPSGDELTTESSVISTSNFTGFGNAIYNLAQTPCLEFEVPYYSPYPVLGNAKRSMENDLEVVKYVNGYILFGIDTTVTASDFNSMTVWIYKAAGDDFMFHQLHPPPLIKTATGNATTLYFQDNYF